MGSPATIVVAYAAIGSGHRIAAEAIADGLASEGSSTVEIVDVLEHGPAPVSGDRLTSAFTGTAAGLYDAAWSHSGLGSAARVLTRPLLGGVFRRFERTLTALSPTVVVSTHALAGVLAADLVRRGKAAFRVVNVATDYGVHGFWPKRGVSLFCVADQGSADILLARGHDSATVAVTGIPLRSQFALEYDRAAARDHFGLPLDRRLVLAIAGSTMPGPYEHFKDSLAVSLPALASLPNSALAVVCGKDEEFADQLRARAAGFGTTNVQIFGYVEKVAALMACADLIVAKPGGGICAEALAAGVPLALVGPAAGQERANAVFVTQSGAGVFSMDARMLAEQARKVLSNPSRMNRMREAAAQAGRPFATDDVVERILTLAAS